MKLCFLAGGSLLSWFVFPGILLAQTGSNPTTFRDDINNTVAVQSTAEVIVHVLSSSGTPLAAQASIKLWPYVLQANQATNPYDGVVKDGLAHLQGIDGGEYMLEVTAPGYQTHRERLTVLPGYVKTQAYVRLHAFDGSSDDLDLEQPGAPVINPSARRDLTLAISAMQAGKPEQALPHVKSALKRAPGNPDAHFIAGFVAEARNDLDTARGEYETAIKLFPSHLSAQISLGQLLVRSNDPAAAIPHLEKALTVGPNSWRANWLLAEAYLLSKPPDLPNCKLHANRAIELGRDRAVAARVTLALADGMEGDLKTARTELESFLREHPNEKSAPRAREALTIIGKAEAAGAARAAIAVPKPVGETSDLEGVSPEAMPGLPASIDNSIPPVSSGVACELPQVLSGAATRSREFVDNLQRFSARELIVHEELDAQGNARKTAQQTYDYVADLRRPVPNTIVMNELRDGNYGYGKDFPAPLAMDGIPAVGLVFNSAFSPDFNFSCEGLGQWRGEPAWQLRFEQRSDHPARIHDWTVAGKTYPAILKGRAWLAAGSYQLLHIDTDLVQPISPIKLEYQHMAIDYAAVNFPNKKNALLLPVTAQIYCKYKGHYFKQEHDYSNFTLFSVDTRETQAKPKSQDHN